MTTSTKEKTRPGKRLSEEQKKARKAHRAENISKIIAGVDFLPDSANVRQPVVQALYGCSSATLWRGVKAGRIPKPRKLSPRTTCWNLGELRKALADSEE